MGVRETIEVTGHLMDSGILSRVLDDIRDYGGDYVIEQFDVGHDAHDPSSARIVIEAEDDASLQRLLMRLQTRGVNPIGEREAALATADRDGVLPDGFYSTTNLETRVRLDGAWHPVENPEMDCGLVVDESDDGGLRVRTVPMADVSEGMRIVVGAAGIEVVVPSQAPTSDAFASVGTDGGSDRPQTVIVRQVADGMKRVRAEGKRLLWVAGPGIVHTGAVPAMVALVRGGYVDVLFAGNALATYDIESALYGTSLGVDVATHGLEHGHEHHVRALNTIRKAGSIGDAVATGVLTSGIMHALVTHEKRYVLVGSVRDDGPLPDVHTDVIEGQRAMRAEVAGVGYCLMMATQLHSVATANILPATVPIVCVDINPSTVTKLADRGTSQGRGIVTDVGLFLEQLALELVADYRRT
ncbi:lysine-ketoglutarate reductase/saccharopine dehydrogenase-like protein (TIGR00300 family) [Nocardioides cavernae]|uniref:ornithine cyclodeaminase n=1 Tax=Nocardioides cavernae TaxID=1921566 RepID=A0A7Y9H7U4_9ACTN|nr:TIGR00300 family protein [Nocardioides cavernae]NYE38919.1 lysine-ketoglutarate reductase/saccharopine dehydrogenase-like protein (TIGR00300 family) [Nocardioides cavernae]